MDNGYIILGIIALLFLSMYGFAYLSVVQEKIKQKKNLKIQQEQEELKKQRLIANQKIRDEKLRKFNQRKEEIQHELMLLEKMKLKQSQKVS
ncbi:hypothetical protein FUA26_08690 [Seonamhaeicola algicola]|uniref:Uncharacterized protein n=1 Tax=Seonamhaeicola algicola TaxID=1719036 RepID=A0A5C7AU43_9FLAO|nr:hypothetical protein [Seonamhaeicola algicola]TXE11133.1 hypothetical protein FUA26_08690 [Seonamhaeicola algicola]